MTGKCADDRMNAMLHAYELGMLSGDEKDEFEAHLLECDICFAHVKEFMPRGAMLVMSPGLKRLLRSEAGERTESLWSRIGALLWPPGLPVIQRPALLLAVIVLLLYPAFVGISDRGLDTVESVDEIGLVQTRSKAPYTVKGDGAVLVSFVCPSEVAGEKCSVVMMNPDGRVIYENASFSGVDKYRVGRLILPSSLISEGEYTLSVRAADASQDTLSSFNYKFEILISGR